MSSTGRSSSSETDEINKKRTEAHDANGVRLIGLTQQNNAEKENAEQL